MKKVLLIIVLAIGVLMAYAATKSSEFHVEESIVLDHSKTKVRRVISNWNNFRSWSPWAEKDTNAVVTITGDGKSVGSTYNWSGNDDIGEGSQSFTFIGKDSIGVDLKFVKPFESQANVFYIIGEDEKGKTKLTWGFDSEKNFMMKLISIFMPMEEGISNDFKKGLNNLNNKLNEKAFRDISIDDIFR